MTDHEICESCGEHLCPECGEHADDCPRLLHEIALGEAEREKARREDPMQRAQDERDHLVAMLHERARLDAIAVGAWYMPGGGIYDRPRLSMSRWNPELLAVVPMAYEDEALEYQKQEAVRSLTHTFERVPRPVDLQAAHAEMLAKCTRGGYTLTVEEAGRWHAERSLW